MTILQILILLAMGFLYYYFHATVVSKTRKHWKDYAKLYGLMIIPLILTGAVVSAITSIGFLAYVFLVLGAGYLGLMYFMGDKLVIKRKAKTSKQK